MRQLVKKRRSPAQDGRRRRGATTVEFALTVPILFLVVFAGYEFAAMNTLRNTVVNAAYEGARAGIVPGASANDARQAAQDILDAVNAKNSQITITPTTIAADTTEVTVTIQVPISDNGWIVPAFFGGQVTRSSCKLQRELIETVSVP